MIFEQHPVSSDMMIRLDSEPVHGDIVIHKLALPSDIKALLLVLKAAVRLGPWTWNILRLFMK